MTLGDFLHGLIVSARQAALSMLETADVGFFTSPENSPETQNIQVSISSGGLCLR